MSKLSTARAIEPFAPPHDGEDEVAGPDSDDEVLPFNPSAFPPSPSSQDNEASYKNNKIYNNYSNNNPRASASPSNGPNPFVILPNHKHMKIWRPEHDKQLIELIKVHNRDWKVIHLLLDPPRTYASTQARASKMGMVKRYCWAETFEINNQVVELHARKHGLTWNKEDDIRLRKMMKSYKGVEVDWSDVSESFPGRSISAVEKRASRLKLVKPKGRRGPSLNKKVKVDEAEKVNVKVDDGIDAEEMNENVKVDNENGAEQANEKVDDMNDVDPL